MLYFCLIIVSAFNTMFMLVIETLFIQLAQSVVDAGAVNVLSPLIKHPDSKLKRQVIEISHMN